MINVDIVNNLKVPNFDFTDDLSNIAERIFIPIMQQNIRGQVAIDGGSFPQLEQNTIKRKERLGQNRGTLIATGTLIESFYSVETGKNQVMISLMLDRLDIGGYLQITGIRSKVGTKFFRFFGINQNMEDNAIAYMKLRIHDAIAAG